MGVECQDSGENETFTKLLGHQLCPIKSPSTEKSPVPEGCLLHQRYCGADNLEDSLPRHKVSYSQQVTRDVWTQRLKLYASFFLTARIVLSPYLRFSNLD